MSYNTELQSNNTELEEILNQVNALPEDAVRYAEQNPTEEQKAQARENIGALGVTELPAAVEDALAQAKASGEFDGAAGHTPVKGTDYFTTEDKNEMVNLVLAALPTWTGGSY